MNVGSMKMTLIKSAKAQLDMHKSLGRRSKLSIIQVAELLDIVSGKTEPSDVHASIFIDNSFSLN
ncbi:MAG: hypothetical protein IT222_13530 [Crocinitomix sp.]|jgi:hypothetical protein|nr:hypothetical protein [Crocinitomix sp.]